MEKLELKNFTQDDVLDTIKDFPLQPTGRWLIITMNSYEPDGNIILSNNHFNEIQYVVAVGSHVMDIKAGQKVMIDVEKMLEYVYPDDNSHEKVGRVKLKTIEVGEDVFALIPESYVLLKDNR